MLKKYNIKINFIIFVTTLSIFFSYVTLLSFPLRFSFLLALPILIYEKILTERKVIFISFLIVIIIFVISFINFIKLNHFFINEILSQDFEKKDLYLKFFKKKLFELGIIFYLILFAFKFHDIIISNLEKIINLFLLIFFISTSLFIIKNPIYLGTIFECTSGFFKLSQFIYVENSHFFLVSVPVLFYIIINLEKYIHKPYLIFLSFYLLIFCTFNSTSSYFLMIMVCSLLLIFINKNLFSKNNYLIFSFLIFNSIIFSINTDCKSVEINFKHNPNKSFIGEFHSPKNKIYDTGIKQLFVKSKKIEDETTSKLLEIYNGKNYPDIITEDQKGRINLSASILIYSIINSLETIKKYPFGVGLNQYNFSHELSFKNYLNNKDVYFGKIYNKLALNFLNFNQSSGSINFSKMLSEFGIIAIIIFIFLVYICFSSKLGFNEKSFYLTVILSQLIIRATGYYNNGFILILILTIVTFLKKNEKI